MRTVKKGLFQLTRGKRIHHVVLADAHQLFRRGLRTLLSAEDDMRFAGELCSLPEVMQALESPLDFLLMDADLLDQAEESQFQRLRQTLLTTPTLFLFREDSNERLETVLRAGGRAYVLKSTPPPVLIMAIRRVAAGLDLKELDSTADLKALADGGRRIGSRPDALTTREQEILRLLAEGRTVRETAGELSLSIKTVEAHKLNLMRKLNIHNRPSLIEYAVQHGYIPAPVSAA